MDGAGRVQNAHFGYSRMHGYQILVVDPEVSPQWTAQGISHALVIQASEVLSGQLGGLLARSGRATGVKRFGAHAMLVPPFHGPPCAGAGIVLARPFVITTGQVVHHAWTHCRRIGYHTPT